MGLDTNGTKFLIWAKAQGVCYTKTATLGRQSLYVDAQALKNHFSTFGYSFPQDQITELLTKGRGYAETFLHTLGATEIRSLDASDFEDATDILDFNLPVGENFKSRFTAVIDSGTLEHIFNFPVAIKNCMEMVQVGGHFLSITPTNNFMGHGFYQFSPELFFRVFNQSNGFALIRMFVFVDHRRAGWFRVTDPKLIGQRVELTNARPTYLAVLARKVESVGILSTPVQQSDYDRMWKRGISDDVPTADGSLSILERLKRSIARALDNSRRYESAYNPKFFTRYF